MPGNASSTTAPTSTATCSTPPTDRRHLRHDKLANEAARMASQIQLWEREVKDGLATLSSTTAPTPTATCSTPPTVDVSISLLHQKGCSPHHPLYLICFTLLKSLMFLLKKLLLLSFSIVLDSHSTLNESINRSINHTKKASRLL
jgi:hypothetical protein